MMQLPPLLTSQGNQTNPLLGSNSLATPTFLPDSNLQCGTMGLPLSTSPPLTNPQIMSQSYPSGFKSPMSTFASCSPSPPFNSPSSTVAALQHFSFSPNNVTRLPTPTPFYPPISPHQHPSCVSQPPRHQHHQQPPLSWNTEPPAPERRLAVNARQRSRVQNMNDAFRALKEKVPGLDEEERTFSKLEVLQCTISYLHHLCKVLGIECSEEDRATSPQVRDRVQKLEKRFVVHGEGTKKRGTKRRPEPY